MLAKISSIILFLVGLINIVPVIVLFFPDRAKSLYGLSIEGDNLSILMRHRGVLLSIVGILLIYSVFKPEFRVLAIAIAFLSKIVFIFLTFTASGYSPEIKQVALIDIAAMVLLAVVLGIQLYGE